MIDKGDAHKVARLFWHNQGEPVAMGCRECPDLVVCGGTRVSAGIFNCLSHCTCVNRSACKHVCPNNSNFVRRVQEVRGFGFDDVEKRSVISLTQLPPFAQLLYSYPKIAGRIQLPIAAIPFSGVFDKAGNGATGLTRAQVEQKYRVEAGTSLILSGVELDRRVEKFWGVQRGRSEVIAAISSLKPAIVTVPNFSAFLDTPRHDALHSFKRIVLSWQELHDAGIRTALHLNAITDRDYERFAAFLLHHTEIRALSVEFETGAAPLEQGDYHVAQLSQLVQRVGRSFHLIFRGDTRWIPLLHAAFPRFTLINGSAAMKTRKRQSASLEGGELHWRKVKTSPDENLDLLLSNNLSVMDHWLRLRTEALAPPVRKQGEKQRARTSEIRAEGHSQAGQMILL